MYVHVCSVCSTYINVSIYTYIDDALLFQQENKSENKNDLRWSNRTKPKQQIDDQWLITQYTSRYRMSSIFTFGNCLCMVFLDKYIQSAHFRSKFYRFHCNQVKLHNILMAMPFDNVIGTSNISCHPLNASQTQSQTTLWIETVDWLMIIINFSSVVWS